MLECWGASGGNALNTNINVEIQGWKGGYSKGFLRLTKTTKAFLTIGGQGLSNQNTHSILGGYNGGGKGYCYSYLGASGGGGTDIRLSANTAESRIIVAGGGGGAGVPNNDNAAYGFGGAGGGINGLTGGGHSAANDLGSGKGGTQTSGGSSSKIDGNPSQPGTPVNGGDAGTGSHSSAGGGGGGYFGGSGGGSAGGGGGSGYIGKVSSFFEFTAETIDGSCSFPSPFDSTNETGHSGNGAIRITPISFVECTNYHSYISFLKNIQTFFFIIVSS